MKTGIIYVAKDQWGAVLYIGQTKRPFEQRLHEHQRQGRFADLQPIWEHRLVPLDKLDAKEQELIRMFRPPFNRVYNDGGWAEDYRKWHEDMTRNTAMRWLMSLDSKTQVAFIVFMYVAYQAQQKMQEMTPEERKVYWDAMKEVLPYLFPGWNAFAAVFSRSWRITKAA